MKLDLSILDGGNLTSSTRAEAGLLQDVSAEGLAQQFPLPAVKDVSKQRPSMLEAATSPLLRQELLEGLNLEDVRRQLTRV
jgi:hypothetical protein